MKRIQFIAPVECIRGNMSGNQDLRYALNDNKAFESPRGQRNYARNYRPSFIGARRASDGRVYFAVKTKSAVHMTTKAINAMALLGGTGALVGAILANKSATPYTSLVALWEYAKQHGSVGVSLRKFASGIIRPALAAKTANISATMGALSFSIKNPWLGNGQTAGAEVSDEVLVKFWPELCPDGIVFSVAGLKGIASDGDTFGDVVDSVDTNLLGLSLVEVGQKSYVVKGSSYLIDGTEYVESSYEIVDGKAYDVTTTAPNA